MFCHQKGFIQEKLRVATWGMQTWQATRTVWSACQDGGVFIEGNRKLREGEVKTVEPHCKHRVLSVRFSCVVFLQLHRV